MQGAKSLCFQDTQKHCRKAIFMERVSDRRPCKNQGMLGINSLHQLGKAERVAETQFIGVGVREEKKFRTLEC